MPDNEIRRIHKNLCCKRNENIGLSMPTSGNITKHQLQNNAGFQI